MPIGPSDSCAYPLKSTIDVVRAALFFGDVIVTEGGVGSGTVTYSMLEDADCP